MASNGYPKSYEKGHDIVLPSLKEGEIIYHMGTKLTDGVLKTNGGRVLMVEAMGATLADARRVVYDKLIAAIKCDNLFYRKDIANF